MNHILSITINVCLGLNIFLAIFVIFRERRDISSTWGWLLVLFFIPLLGFVLYLTFGQNLRREKLFQWDDQKKIGLKEMITEQAIELKENTYSFRNISVKQHFDLIYMHLTNNGALLSENNDVTIFTDGKEKFKNLIQDIREAERFIHMQYYIIKNDNLGKEVIAELTKKAKEGVKVRVLYDELGSRGLKKKAFAELREAGGEVEVFFPSKFHLINLRMNYRNHRKLVIIDGNVGYVGGFNVGDEYLGHNPKFGYWRDTHLRLTGSAVYAMQIRFILDWNQASHRHDIAYNPSLFPPRKVDGDVGVQIVTSGPDSEWEQIKLGYIKLIMSAKKSILIQTPYFIPDASLLDALRTACLTGKDVKIMIPNKPDHMFVYWATLSNIGELLKTGAKVYIYENGFIHAKMIIIDEEVSSVGTANIDVRSFRLNFEVNAFIYNCKVSKQLAQAFTDDIKFCHRLTLMEYSKRSYFIRFKESISRLLSPIL
ncbi:cardiolipin synthase [Bacillus massiliigorillae]|uniref:cardiolipin synthase n=1 Tax=Bacillus massiliigorillae TaxID=1243664 RepID=UPI00039FDF87|nr:cardiolipin synthase [Bacillus massiliigorillae]